MERFESKLPAVFVTTLRSITTVRTSEIDLVTLGPSRMQQAFDCCVCALALMALAPALLLIAAGVFLESGLPILFRQTRVGQHGRPFRLLKFRTMRVGLSGPPITASGDRRITRVGSFLRKFKLDELPQLWNVVRGEMALVGPRPEVPEFLDYRSPVWRPVLRVRPGITDVATIVYRHEEKLLAQSSDPLCYYREVVLPAKLALNLAYLQTRSFWLDLKVILLTVRYSASPGAFDPSSIEEALALGDSR